MCRSKGMAIRGHISGRGPRCGKDERQRTFRAVHVTGAAILIDIFVIADCSEVPAVL